MCCEIKDFSSGLLTASWGFVNFFKNVRHELKCHFKEYIFNYIPHSHHWGTDFGEPKDSGGKQMFKQDVRRNRIE